MNLIPYSRYARTVLDREKRPFLPELLDEPDTPLVMIQVPRGKRGAADFVCGLKEGPKNVRDIFFLKIPS